MPACTRSSCYRLQENQGREGKLTKASGWPELPRKGEYDDDRRRRESSARGSTATGGLRALITLGQLKKFLRR
jgi:hypothetical protein